MIPRSDIGTAELKSGELISNKVSNWVVCYFNEKELSSSANQQLQQQLEKKRHKITSDLAERREAFLQSRIRPFWLTPEGIEFIKKHLILKIFSRTVQTGPYQFCFVEDLSIECKPANLERIFLKKINTKKKGNR